LDNYYNKYYNNSRFTLLTLIVWILQVTVTGIYIFLATFFFQQLATLLITQQLIQNVQESVFPYINYKRHNIQVEKSSVGLVKIKRIRDPKNQVTREGNLPNYAVRY